MSRVPCPNCGEPIRSEAIKCRHCRRLLEPPRSGIAASFDFWGPVAVVLGGFVIVLLVMRPSGDGAPESFVGPQGAASAAIEAPSHDGGARASDDPESARAEAERGGDGRSPKHWKAKYRRGAASPRAPERAPDARSSAGRVGSAQEPPPTGAPDEGAATRTLAARPRDLRSPIFGYGLRLPNETGWQLVFTGTSRDTLARRDSTAHIMLWVDVNDAAATTPARCLADYAQRVDARLRRAGLKVTARQSSTRAGRYGLEVHASERDSIGAGPRRQAGRYRIAFAADGHLCFGFEGFTGVPASKAARAEVLAAFRSFDVDPTTRRKSATPETRRKILEAAGTVSNTAAPLVGVTVLLDTGTALAALWPGEATGWRLLGVGLLQAGQPGAALRALQRALTTRDEAAGEEARVRRFVLHTLVADAHAHLKKWDPADKALSDARAIIPDHPQVKYLEASFLARRGRLEKAIDALEASLRAWPIRASPPRFTHGLAQQVRMARADPRLGSLRQEPGFEILLRRFEARARKASD